MSLQYQTPQIYDVVERYHRTLTKSARCLLIESRLPKFYRVRANYVRNLASRKTDGKNSFKKIFKRNRKTDLLKAIDCLPYLKNSNAKKKQKLDIKTRKCALRQNSVIRSELRVQKIKRSYECFV